MSEWILERRLLTDKWERVQSPEYWAAISAGDWDTTLDPDVWRGETPEAVVEQYLQRYTPSTPTAEPPLTEFRVTPADGVKRFTLSEHDGPSITVNVPLRLTGRAA